jgi:hypothetical protein
MVTSPTRGIAHLPALIRELFIGQYTRGLAGKFCIYRSNIMLELAEKILQQGLDRSLKKNLSGLMLMIVGSSLLFVGLLVCMVEGVSGLDACLQSPSK